MDRPKRKSMPKLPERALPPSPAAKKKLENLRYRSKIKEDACRYQVYKARQAENSRQWRKNLTEEQKSVQRERARLRQIAFRSKQKEQNTTSKSPAVTNGCQKPITRAENKKVQDMRERNRLAQQKRRANMSTQKKRREREKSLARWHSRFDKVIICPTSSPTGSSVPPLPSSSTGSSVPPLPSSSSTRPSVPPLHSSSTGSSVSLLLSIPVTLPLESFVESMVPSTSEPHLPLPSKTPQKRLSKCYSTVTARTSAVHRLKKKIGKGGKMLVALKHLVKSVNKKKSEQLSDLGIAYASPTKSRSVLHEPHLVSVASDLKPKRNKDSLKAKGALVSSAERVLGKYGSKVFLKSTGLTPKHRSPKPYAKRRDSKGEVAKNFFMQRSTFIPGKRGTTKKLGPRKILDTSVSDLLAEFIKEHGIMMSKATFYRKRPDNVLSFTKIPFRQCLCEVCLNPLLKIKILAGFCGELFPDVSVTVSALVNKTVCEEKMECLRRECDKCSVNGLDEMLERARSACTGNVEWLRWERCEKNGKKRVDLVRKVGTIDDIGEELKDEVDKLPLHCFTAKWQSTQYRLISQSLKPDLALITMDFAENYTCLQQDQPQSAYFGYTQVTIHPSVVQYKCLNCEEQVTDNLVFVSDELDHDAHMVHAITLNIFKHLKNQIGTSVKKVVIFSDGCSAQYKSKVPFEYLRSYNDMGFDIERCFFGSRHGKNPCDALGGLVKNAASRSVKSRRYIIQNAADFMAFATKELEIVQGDGACLHMRRSFHLIMASDIITSLDSKACKTLTGTRKLHSIRTSDEGLHTRNLSCFCQSCLDGSYMLCSNTDFVEPWSSNITSDKKSTAVRRQLNAAFLMEKSFTCSDSRESFFETVLDKFEACSTYDDLVKMVDLVSPHFQKYPLPHVAMKSVFDLNVCVDACALKLVPERLGHLYPVLINSDGNCVPRSLSLLIFGSEDKHVEIRCRIVEESVLHSAQYLSLPQTELDQLSLLSDFHDSDNIVNTYQSEVLSVCKQGTFMGLWQFMAACNVFQITLISVYPHKGPASVYRFYNKTFTPRMQPVNDQRWLLFWSSCRADMQDQYWVANHVMPLLPLTTPVEVVLE